MTSWRRLLLVGGGHAHLEVLRQLADRPLRDAHVTLVSAFAYHHYSSVVPGYLQGTHDERGFVFDLRGLCRAAAAEFVQGYAVAIDAPGRQVRLGPPPSRLASTMADDPRSVRTPEPPRDLTYDVLSIDVGSEPTALDTPGVRDHAATVRPMTRAIALKRRLDELIGAARAQRSADAATVAVCVVGAGASGVEITLAVARRLREAGLDGRLALVDRGPSPLHDYSPRVQRRIARLLERRGVRLLLDRAVEAVEPSAVRLNDGTRLDAALTIWLTGPAAPRLFGTSTLATDDHGFLVVDDTLRSVSDPNVWGAGDCVTLTRHRWVAKAGVYAVREAPILAHNLRAVLDGGPLRPFAPQRHFLAILNTGDARALLRWRTFSVHAHWALGLKNWIDRRFVRKYQHVSAVAPHAPQTTP